MWRLPVAFLMALFAFAKGAQMLLNGKVTNRTEFCAGESLTLVCSGTDRSASSWTIPGTSLKPNDLQVSSGVRTVNMEGFLSQYISGNEARLTFIAVSFLNDTNITCRDSLNNIDVENFLISLHDLPSAPNITSILSSDKSYFSVSITPTDPAAICVQQYNLTFLNGTGGAWHFNVPASEPVFNSSSVSFADLGLCTATINVEVVASSGGGVATEMNIVLFTATDYRITATLMGNKVILTVPDVLQSCITSYTYYFQGATGYIDANVEIIMLSMFSLEPCNASALIINPVILKVARASAGASVDICVPAARTLPTAIIVAIGVTGTFVFGVLVSAVVMIVVFLAWKNKKKIANSIAGNEYIDATDNAAEKSEKTMNRVAMKTNESYSSVVRSYQETEVNEAYSSTQDEALYEECDNYQCDSRTFVSVTENMAHHGVATHSDELQSNKQNEDGNYYYTIRA